MNVLIALGSNLGNREQHIALALEAIGDRIGAIEATSRSYETEPVLHPDRPVPDQEKFLNAVCSVQTELRAEVVLSRLLEIELSLGRIRNEDNGIWGPRTIDLDIVGADQLIVNTSQLTIPHPRMHEREFVLEPLVEIAPDWRHPLLGKTVRELWDELSAERELTAENI